MKPMEPTSLKCYESMATTAEYHDAGPYDLQTDALDTSFDVGRVVKIVLLEKRSDTARNLSDFRSLRSSVIAKLTR